VYGVEPVMGNEAEDDLKCSPCVLG
jgi:hypothetical protein